MLNNFLAVMDAVKSQGKKRIAVAMADDKDILAAIQKAKKEGIAEAILIGDSQKILEIFKKEGLAESDFTIDHVEGEIPAIDRSVSIIQNGKAEVLMKGRCSTANFLRAVLHKENGLKASNFLSHLAAFEVSTYHKLLLMSDAALNIEPDLPTKIAMVNNAVSVAHKLQIERPKVAIIAAVEKVNPEAMPCTAHAAVISQMAKRGQIKNAIVDGPLAVDNALSAKSCEVKGITSPVSGDADILIMPDIEAGNSFYKALALLAKAKTAGIIVGAKVPVVLPSRADNEETKFLSIAFAMLVS